MTLKKIIDGQTVFVMGGGHTQRDKFSTTAAEVVKIDRKYVTISGNLGSKFKGTSESRPYLVEHTEYGTPRLLFPSREAVGEYLEREELKIWVRTTASWEHIDRYTLAQLRAVMKILEGDSNG